MPTYLQLEAEPVWGRQFTPPALASLASRLRKRLNLGPNDVGSGGDNNHLTGRHRSRNWVLQSRYCTRRSYGTQDARDLAGDGDWYRAIDIGITGQTLFAACRRLDAAVRAGRLPGVAEWFGTVDGQTVVGWYEGHASSSDSSHLSHLHIGVWTGSADDAALMDLLYAIVTGEDEDMTPDQAAQLQRIDARLTAMLYDAEKTDAFGSGIPGEANQLHARMARIEAAVAKLSAPTVDVKGLAAALAADSGFKQALAQAAFEGAQRAERE